MEISAIFIDIFADNITQGRSSVVISPNADKIQQQDCSVLIGKSARQIIQRNNSIAIGTVAETILIKKKLSFNRFLFKCNILSSKLCCYWATSRHYSSSR